MILAGDIGGTKTLVALFEPSGHGVRRVRERTFASSDHTSLDSILAEFLAPRGAQPLHAACFGVAGPVIAGRCETTNLPWVLDEQALASVVGVARVKLLNDLEAAAYGMLYLEPDDFAVLNTGADSTPPGNVAVIAAGTGLGEAMLYWDGVQHHPMASEGGHADFAPRTEQEIQLLRYLQDRFEQHVSYERVVSGPGLLNIYEFLRDSRYAPEPGWLAEKLVNGDRSATITEVGLAGEASLCVATLELFSSIYGAEAGNLALKCLAVGGVVVGGGIAPKLLRALDNGSFIRSFTDKGRFAEFLRRIEVKIALNAEAPLLGTAHYARRFLMRDV
ncbi:MAG: glucokinase [Candidatus Binatia bacterium]